MRVAAALAVLAACGRLHFDDRDATTVVDDEERITARELVVPLATTSSATFEDIGGATLTIPPSPGTRWLLLVTASLESSSLEEGAAEARYLVDGIERGLGGTEVVVAGRPGPWMHAYVVDGTNASIAVTFQLRDALAATTTLHGLRAIAAPLPPDADTLFASADAPTSVMRATSTPVHTLTLDAARAGEYLVLLLVNASEAPGSSDVVTLWLDPAGQPWQSDVQVPRSSWQSSLVIRRASLPAGPTSIVLEARTNSTAQVQYARAIAVRTDAFAGTFAHDESRAALTATTPTLTTSLELRPVLAPAPQYLVFGTTRVDDECTAAVASRGLRFVADGDAEDLVWRPGNCAYETTHGFLRLLPAAPSYLSLAFSAVDAIELEHDESALLVLGVD